MFKGCWPSAVYIDHFFVVINIAWWKPAKATKWIIIHDHITLTHWGRVTHICVHNLTIIGSNNSLSPGRLPAINGTNADILLIGTLRTNFSEILIQILTLSLKKMHLKVSSAKWRPFCLGLNVLNNISEVIPISVELQQREESNFQRNFFNFHSWNCMKMGICNCLTHL